MSTRVDFTPVVAALCLLHGKPVEGGGYEIFIPFHLIAELSPTGEIQKAPDDLTNPGWRFRYRANRVIDSVVVSSEPIEDVSTPPHIDE